MDAEAGVEEYVAKNSAAITSLVDEVFDRGLSKVSCFQWIAREHGAREKLRSKVAAAVIEKFRRSDQDCVVVGDVDEAFSVTVRDVFENGLVAGLRIMVAFNIAETRVLP